MVGRVIRDRVADILSGTPQPKRYAVLLRADGTAPGPRERRAGIRRAWHRQGVAGKGGQLQQFQELGGQRGERQTWKLFIGHIHIQDVDMFGPRVGFIKFKARALVDIGVSDKSGKREDGEDGVIKVPGIVFMRGGSVHCFCVNCAEPLSSRICAELAVFACPCLLVRRWVCS